MRPRKPGIRLFVPGAIAALGWLVLVSPVKYGHCEEGLGRYPGFMWSQARNRSDLIDERDNNIIEGAIQQGIDWIIIGDHFRLNTFLQLQGDWDEEALDWNRSYTYSLGGKVRYSGIARTLISLGARYDTENRTVSNNTRSGTTGFLSWGSYWDLAELTGIASEAIGAQGLPGTTWGELRFPASHFEEEVSSTILEGAVEQGIDWKRLYDKVTLNTFARIEYTVDSKELDWNNKIKAGPGAKLKIAVGTEGLLELGAQYQWHHRLESNRTRSGAIFFLNWNLAWGFGEFAQKSY